MDSPNQVEPDLLRRKYQHCPKAGEVTHIWSVVGEAGGLHLWITVGGTRPYGGVEIHYRTPPDYMSDKEPSQEHCWLLDGPCWHDGSSLYAEEVWIPRWLANPDDHDWMLAFLSVEYRKRFAKELADGQS